MSSINPQALRSRKSPGPRHLVPDGRVCRQRKAPGASETFFVGAKQDPRAKDEGLDEAERHEDVERQGEDPDEGRVPAGQQGVPLPGRELTV